MKKNRNSPLNNIQNTSIKLGESPLQQNEAQSSKNSITSENLKIPPLGGFESIIVNPIEHKVAKMPFIPGPTSSYNARYIALKRAQGISNWTYGKTGKRISNAP